MSLFLLILGSLFAGAGIVTIGLGVPINEFNLGGTMIIAGTTAIAGGAILIGLSAAVHQLTQIANALRPRAGSRPVAQPAEQAFPAAIRPGPSPVQAPAADPSPPKPPMPAPPRAPVFANPKAEEQVGEPASPEPAAEVSFSAIERLRSSLGRADRKASDTAATEDVSYPSDAPRAAPAASGAGVNTAANWAGNGAAPTGGTGAGEGVKKPPLDFLFRAKAREPQPEPFDAVWPKRAARRADEQADLGGSLRPAEAPVERPSVSEAPAAAPEELRPAAILKSGVVDGMAYTLYADGSIEAQLPQGTVRFGSIAELRLHIENNS